MSVLSYGSSGAEVRELQRKLNSKGYSLGMDGQFGPATQAAVEDYQRKHGLTADGCDGPQTQAVLDSDPVIIDKTASSDRQYWAASDGTKDSALSFLEQDGITPSINILDEDTFDHLKYGSSTVNATVTTPFESQASINNYGSYNDYLASIVNWYLAKEGSSYSSTGTTSDSSASDGESSSSKSPSEMLHDSYTEYTNPLQKVQKWLNGYSNLGNVDYYSTAENNAANSSGVLDQADDLLSRADYIKWLAEKYSGGSEDWNSLLEALDEYKGNLKTLQQDVASATEYYYNRSDAGAAEAYQAIVDGMEAANTGTTSTNTNYSSYDVASPYPVTTTQQEATPLSEDDIVKRIEEYMSGNTDSESSDISGYLDNYSDYIHGLLGTVVDGQYQFNSATEIASTIDQLEEAELSAPEGQKESYKVAIRIMQDVLTKAASYDTDSRQQILASEADWDAAKEVAEQLRTSVQNTASSSSDIYNSFNPGATAYNSSDSASTAYNSFDISSTPYNSFDPASTAGNTYATYSPDDISNQIYEISRGIEQLSKGNDSDVLNEVAAQDTDQENQQEVSEEDYQKLLDYAQANDAAWDQDSTAAEMLEKVDAGGYNAAGAYDMGQYAQTLPKDKTDIWKYIGDNIAYGATEAIVNPINAAVTDTGDFFTGGGVSDSYRDLVYYFLDHPDEYRALMENDPSIAGYSYDSQNGDQGSQFYQQLSEETGKSASELGRFYNEYAASYSDSMNEITNGKSLSDLQKFGFGYIPHTMANILTTMAAFKVLDLALASMGDVGTSLADAGSAGEDLDSAYSAYKDASLDMEAADKADSDAINGLINQENGGKMESSSIGDTPAAIPENVPVTPLTPSVEFPYEEATSAEGVPYADGFRMPESDAPLSISTEGAGDSSLDSDILIDSYKNMRNNPDVTGQSHHLNQDAAFRDVIPKNDGLCVELEGNAFRDAGSPHYSAHENLESFWNNFRSKGDLYGDTPKISDYNSALYDSLRAAGLSDAQAKVAVQNAVKQQSQYGLVGDSFVPRIPGRINFKR